MIVKTIGRGQENNIVVNDNKISRVHLQLIQDDRGNISVVDLNSKNGTFVNGRRISAETHLKAGDELRIGDTVLPWQDYFVEPQKPGTQAETSTGSFSSSPAVPSNSQAFKHSSIKKWLYVIGGLIVALLIAGGIVLHLNSNRNSDKDRVDDEKEQMKRLLNASEADYDDLKNQNEEAKKQMEEQRKSFEEESRIADSLAKARNENALSQAKRKADLEKQKAVDTANAIAKRNIKKAVDDERVKADSVANEKDKKARKKIEEEKKAKEEAVEETRLTKLFYEELQKAVDKNNLDKVCEAVLGKDVSWSERNKRYSKIVNKFNSVKTNKERKEIIDKIKGVNK